MSTQKKAVIHEFACEIFPRKLWIVKDAPYSWIKERFTNINGDELKECDKEEAVAVTYPEVEHLKSNKYGILIVILDKMSISDCAHEATHFVLSLFKAIGEGVSTDHQEVMAYLVGYATDCIYQVVTNKYRPMFDGSKERS